MDFRAVALIALWTLISGPIFGVPSGPVSAQNEAKVIKPKLEVRQGKAR